MRSQLQRRVPLAWSVALCTKTKQWSGGESTLCANEVAKNLFPLGEDSYLFCVYKVVAAALGEVYLNQQCSLSYPSSGSCLSIVRFCATQEAGCFEKQPLPGHRSGRRIVPMGFYGCGARREFLT